MARTAKKVTALTAEEKLAQALVPESEQPYKVPENWVYIYQKSICNLSNGEKKVNLFLPYLEVKYLRGFKDAEIVESGNYITAGTKVILVDGENSGEVFAIYEDGFMGSTFKALDISLAVNPDYLRLFISTKKELYRNNKKGSAIPHLNKDLFYSMPFPLSPLAEQQRIVDRIESLFAKLDEAKEKAQAVVDGFEDRKAAILHKAFTGVLTAGWREDNSISDSSWDKKRIDQISHPRAGYAFDSKKFTDHGFQIVRMGNLYGGSLDLSRSPVFISPEDIEEKAMNRSLINDGDILITLTGTKYKRDYGYAVCVRGQKDLLVNQRILCLSPKETVITNYLLYYLQSNIFRDIFFSNETGGVNQGNVSSKFVEGIEIALPPIKEQQKIVEILDRVFEKETIALEAAEQVIDQIDTMKKAILARAFRGELGTNDPTDESAEELLKWVL